MRAALGLVGSKSFGGARRLLRREIVQTIVDIESQANTLFPCSANAFSGLFASRVTPPHEWLNAAWMIRCCYLIETGTVKHKDDVRLWVFKNYPARGDNLLCAAMVLETELVVKTVMHHFTPE